MDAPTIIGGISAVLFAAFGLPFAAQLVFKALLSGLQERDRIRAEHESKERLQRQEHEAQQHRQRLQHEADLAAQRIAAELQVATHRDQTTTTFLLERRFQAVTRVYENLIDFHMELEALHALATAEDKARGLSEALPGITEKIPEFFHVLRVSRIWFDRDTCASLDLVGTVMMATLLHSTYDVAKASKLAPDMVGRIESEYFAYAAENIGRTTDDVLKLASRLRPLLDKTIGRIESQLRALIGTPDSPDREPPSMREQIRTLLAPSEPAPSERAS